MLHSLFAIALLAAPAAQGSPLDRVERWFNDQFSGQVPRHFSQVRTEGGDVLCAYAHLQLTDNYTKVLIDARRKVAWLDTPAFPHNRPQQLFQMDRERQEQWSRCQRAGEKG